MTRSHRFGKWAEDQAASYLQHKGYAILERNFRYDRAEIDIIAARGNLIVVVEVKARSSDYFGDPQDFISRKKVARLVKAANYYMNLNELSNELRFDAVAILRGEHGVEIEHLEDAFYFF